MSDLTPPPDEPMSDQARARIRAELLAASRGGRSGRHRWLVPGVAAAAVLLVAGLAGWAVRAGGDGAPEGGPAAGPSSSAPPTDESTVVATTKPGAVSSSVPPEDAGNPVGTASCESELANVLPGAERAVSFPDGTSFWVTGDRFVLCDERAGTTTVHHPLPLDPDDGVATFRVSSISPPAPSRFWTVRVAGGIVPEGAEAFYDVRYTFPDGHTERATTRTDDQGRSWWRMVYAYDEGPGSELDLPPIEVTVSYSGVQHTYRLRWGVDTCAQANHGC